MADATCTVDGCDTRTRTASSPYCEKHYYRLRRTGTVEPVRPWHRRGTCEIDGCDKAERLDGYCGMHYYRLRRTGRFDLFPHEYPSGEASHKWVGDEITGWGIHVRLRNFRGRASQYACIDCGDVARDWSYDHSDPNEKRDSYGVYSTDMNRYEPRCSSCHKRFDIAYRAAVEGGSV